MLGANVIVPTAPVVLARPDPTNLVVELDASVGLALTGALVDSWTCRKGTVWTGAGAARPSTALVGGLPCIDFGNAHYLTGPTSGSLFPNNAHYFAVRVYVDAIDALGGLSGGAFDGLLVDGAGGNLVGMFLGDLLAPTLPVYSAIGYDTGDRVTTGATITYSTWITLECYHGGGRLYSAVNGAAFGNDVALGNLHANYAAITQRLGVNGGPSRWLDGKFRKCIIRNAYTASQRAQDLLWLLA